MLVLSNFSGSPAARGIHAGSGGGIASDASTGCCAGSPQCEAPAGVDIVPAYLWLISQMCEGPPLCLEQTFECPFAGESERLKMADYRPMPRARKTSNQATRRGP